MVLVGISVIFLGFKLMFIGLFLMAGGWIWSIVTGVQMMQESVPPAPTPPTPPADDNPLS